MAQISTIPGIVRFVPDAYVPKHFFRTFRDNVSGRLVIQSTIDGGANYRTWLPEITEDVQPGYGLVIGEDKNAKWAPVQAASTSSSGGGNGTGTVGTIFVDLPFYGEATAGRIFYGFKVPPSLSFSCIGMQIVAQDAPQGASIQMDLVDISGTAQARVSSLSSGNYFNETIFPTPLTMSNEEIWRLKFLQVGSTFAGSNITFRLILSGI
jgi:hypothetical protein